MKLEQFQSGVWRQQYKYKSFQPATVNREWVWEDPTVNALLEKATQALGELNAFSLIVPDIDLFIQMHVVKEAQTSSRIEGTQTGMEEAILHEEQIQPEKRDDWREVRNYIDAINISVGALETMPLSNRLLKDTHAILMQGVRGEHKQPGEFRSSQNWIGGSSLADAVFIPPHQNDVSELMGDLEAFWHNEAIMVPHLIRIAISHYQFETIHPFLDGNGRIGRYIWSAMGFQPSHRSIYPISSNVTEQAITMLLCGYVRQMTLFIGCVSSSMGWPRLPPRGVTRSGRFWRYEPMLNNESWGWGNGHPMPGVLLTCCIDDRESHRPTW
ncbi:MAG: cell filamentation protein Fic [Chlorobi bacterium]|nr:cell filamentation protein Fic [Chlorobiota bacterium]